jgi:phosphoribosylglycinamide formyltransferase-1
VGVSEAKPKRLGVLLSGRGSNFIAIADAIAAGSLAGCEIACVLSNIADAPGIATAQQRGFATEIHVSKGVPREEHDARMAAALNAYEVDLVILAGYMRVLSPGFIHAFPDRILNIHPSLLPAFPGLHAQQQALNYGTKFAGCTVHFVDEAVDHGVIILQKVVPVLDGDDEAALSARILEQEHTAYAEAIARVLSGEYRAHGQRYLHIG